MRRRAFIFALLVTTSIGGCVREGNDGSAEAAGSSNGDSGDAGDSGGALVSLIDQQAWTVVEAQEDPLVEHRPALVECGIAGWTLEVGNGLEIDTNYCNYLALGQPTLAPIVLGTTVELDFYHFDLTAPEPAEAHFAVVIDGQILWEVLIPIPGKANFYTESFAAPFAAPAGAELVVHLHNHGQNTWVFADLRAWVAD